MRKPTPPLTYDPADSSMPRAPLTLERVGESEDWRELVQAIAAALEEAIDLNAPHRTAARCLTAASIIKVISEHPARLEWAVNALRQLVQSWQGDGVA
jgi:hypothetical protein